MAVSSHPLTELNKAQGIILLRWVLIIATAYLVLFSRPLPDLPPSAALFIAAYFASNIVLRMLLPRVRSAHALDVAVVLIDCVMVSIGMALSGTASSQFFVLYFVVVFLSALTERAELVALAAVLVGAAHLYGMAQFTGVMPLIRQGYAMQIPFLFVVALFFGNLVAEARGHERKTEEQRTHELQLEFLSTLSHDIKNPLGVIQSLAHLLLEGDGGTLTDRQTSLVRRIQASTQHVIAFSLNLIDAARVDMGKLTLQRRPTELADVVDDALVLVRSAAELKGVAVQCAIASPLPLLSLDPVQMQRVISNLVGNAIKFTPAHGAVSLSVRCPTPDAVLLEVSDTGTGIAAADLPAILEKYRHFNPSGSIDGSGLGLFIVNAIVEAHGGSVDISSTAGAGTVVTVRLPRWQLAAALPDSTRVAAPALVPSGEFV